MTDYLKEIDRGLIIEEPEVIIPWNLEKRDIFDMIKSINITNENYYTFKIVLSGIPFVNCAGLHFEKEILSKINLFNDEGYPESEITDVFNNHQLVLENLFGKSVKCLLAKLKGFDKEYKWKFRYVTIIHRLWDRFGME